MKAISGPDVVDGSRIAIPLGRCLTVIRANSRPAVTEFVDFAAVMPGAHIYVLARVEQVCRGNAIGSQLAEVDGIDLHAADINAGIGVVPDGLVTLGVFLNRDRAKDTGIDRMKGCRPIETVCGTGAGWRQADAGGQKGQGATRYG